ncbi:hypothetical protein [Leptolyngbya sp. PCC 6406]|uniref:hypothetical protein n=1 Tax=Leptolyngbya sp. PCC 6406 TaxID=1173264 RepID=UPI0002ACBBBE|nr:hypothetical protein [Leptolyngbya sp. PCC 6406]
MTSEYLDNAIGYFLSIKEKLESTGNNSKTIKLKNILAVLGYRRRSQLIVDKINCTLSDLQLSVNPSIDMSIDFDRRISISLKNKAVKTEQNNSSVRNKSLDLNAISSIQVKCDFLSHLFDLGSEQEYERLQACLDSNQPIGIFFVPLEDDFFSEVVIKVLNYELIRKYQYLGISGTPSSSTSTFSSVSSDLATSHLNINDVASTSGIIRFDRETMHNVLLGKTGLEMLDSEQFENEFSQVSLYAHKYNNEQFFVVFHCPSELEIRKQGRLDLFSDVVDKVSERLPFTFTLKCKYSSSNSLLLDQEVYKDICSHLKLLMEMPSYESEEEEATLLEYFVELQKAQAQFESQLFLTIEPHYFNKLTWGHESTEHIYLKYFAIRTLEEIGYNLLDIQCEKSIEKTSEIIDVDAR